MKNSNFRIKLAWPAIGILLILALTIMVVRRQQTVVTDAARPTHSNANTIERENPLTKINRYEASQLLFFATSSLDELVEEKRNIRFDSQQATERITVLWDELKHTPNPQHVPLIPNYLTPTAVLIGANGIVYIDLPVNVVKTIEIGAAWEQLMIEAIVNTIVTNTEKVSAVKFLVDGQDLFSLGGHLYTLRPIPK